MNDDPRPTSVLLRRLAEAHAAKAKASKSEAKAEPRLEGDGSPDHEPDAAEPIVPVDLWNSFDPPELPIDLLPPIIERYARAQGKLIGADPAGLAMACLAVCAATITDEIRLQPFVNNPGWRESARLWIGLVGDVSDKKTPIIREAIWPLDDLDAELFMQWSKVNAEYEALSKEEQQGQPKPAMQHLILNNLTIEAAEEAMAASPHGILVHNDELAEWFGSMERYHSSGKGSSDRPFWLQAYNGGRRRVTRIRRGHLMIENASACLLGGIQPEKIREVATMATDDGLLQRFLAIMLRPASLALDKPQGDESRHYKRLIQRLYAMRQISSDMIVNRKLRFADDAQPVFYRVQRHNADLSVIKVLHHKAAAAFLKGDGLFARLCVIFHCIEHANSYTLPFEIALATAERVERFLTKFLQPHQLAFYVSTLGIEDEDELLLIGNVILAHRLITINKRIVQQAIRGKRIKGDPREHFERLFALGWLTSIEQKRANDPGTWIVNPTVHERFAARAKVEVARRKAARAAFQRLTTDTGEEGKKP